MIFFLIYLGYIGEHSAYHHGEMSLNGTIIGMAQSYAGSNNINLLYPAGQFGTRRMGGKDHASARYIFTRLEKITRTIFHPDDDALLNYLNDDGLSIEPEYYMPVIPMVLINGSDGIGTGYSSTIQNHDPREVIANLRRMINGDEAEVMHPHFSGYTGEITAETGKREGSYIVKGKIERTNETTLLISELPIGKWTQDYKAFLEGLMTGTEKTPSEISDFKENHTDTTVSFTVTATQAKIDEFEKFKGGLNGKFKLSTSISTNNMTLFDDQGKIHKYKTSLDILGMFFHHRLEFYLKRKAMLLEKMSKELTVLDNKARFVEEVCKGELVVSNRKRKELLNDLKERGYDLFPKDAKKATDEEDEEDGSVDESPSDAELSKGYEYLLGMKSEYMEVECYYAIIIHAFILEYISHRFSLILIIISVWSLTFERAEELRRQKAEKAEEVEALQATSPESIWLSDLDAIDEALNERDVDNAAELKREVQAQKKNTARNAKKATAAKKKTIKAKKKTNEWDSDLEDDDSDDDFIVAKPAPKAKAAPKKSVVKKPVVKAVKSIVKMLSPRKPAPPVAKASTSSIDDATDVLEKLSINEPKEVAKPAPKKAAPAKKAAPVQKAPAKKKKYDSSDDDSDDFMGDDSDSEVEMISAPVPARARSGRAAAKKVVYEIDSDSDSEAEFSDGDESDF